MAQRNKLPEFETGPRKSRGFRRGVSGAGRRAGGAQDALGLFRFRCEKSYPVAGPWTADAGADVARGGETRFPVKAKVARRGKDPCTPSVDFTPAVVTDFAVRRHAQVANGVCRRRPDDNRREDGVIEFPGLRGKRTVNGAKGVVARSIHWSSPRLLDEICHLVAPAAQDIWRDREFRGRINNIPRHGKRRLRAPNPLLASTFRL